MEKVFEDLDGRLEYSGFINLAAIIDLVGTVNKRRLFKRFVEMH